jgi:hypothetical protein
LGFGRLGELWMLCGMIKRRICLIRYQYTANFDVDPKAHESGTFCYLRYFLFYTVVMFEFIWICWFLGTQNKGNQKSSESDGHHRATLSGV